MLANYKILALASSMSVMAVAHDASLNHSQGQEPLITLDFSPYSQLGDGVAVKLKLTQTQSALSLSGITATLVFYDWQTKDVIYSFVGNLDSNSNSYIVEVMMASEEFESVFLEIDATLVKISEMECFNSISEYGLKLFDANLPNVPASSQKSIFEIITNQDVTPTSLSMIFEDNFEVYMEMVRASQKLNTRLFVEFDPSLSVDQVINLAEELNIDNHRIRFLWSPVVARPLNAAGLKGKKQPRHVSGYVLSQHMLRDANTNVNGIPPLSTPIAGYDFSVSFAGVEQRQDVVLDDPTRKRLADAKINVLQRQKYPNGVRYVIGDVLTAYKDNNSLLMMTNASDVSMFIDNRLIEIVKRHLLKATSDTISDSLRDCTRFLESCTSKDRLLLVNSIELGGYFNLSIVRRADRVDAVDLNCSYHPDGATRAIYLNTTVTN